jgi:hypothetical protein
LTQRHLLPDEIDLFLEDEAGASAPGLVAHIAECSECREQVEDARFVIRELERLPRLAPSHRFADAVMQEVSVIVPWHVALRDTVVRYLPATPAARAAALAVASLSAAVLSGGLIWLLSQSNVPVALTSVAESQLRDLLLNSGARVVSVVFGEEALAMLARSGTAGLAALLAGLIAATTGAVASLRAIALAANRRRN